MEANFGMSLLLALRSPNRPIQYNIRGGIYYLARCGEKNDVPEWDVKRVWTERGMKPGYYFSTDVKRSFYISAVLDYCEMCGSDGGDFQFCYIRIDLRWKGSGSKTHGPQYRFRMRNLPSTTSVCVCKCVKMKTKISQFKLSVQKSCRPPSCGVLKSQINAVQSIHCIFQWLCRLLDYKKNVFSTLTTMSSYMSSHPNLSWSPRVFKWLTKTFFQKNNFLIFPKIYIAFNYCFYSLNLIWPEILNKI